MTWDEDTPGAPQDILDAIDNILAGEDGEEDGDGGGAVTGTSQVGITGATAITETTTGRRESDFLTRETVRTYINIPTAEEVFNDFERGFTGHVMGLVQAGELSDTDANLAFGQIGQFAREYFGELAAMAERGEDIYRIVGLEGEPEFLGEREGAVSDSVRTGVSEQETETTRQETGQQTVAESGEQTTTPAGEAPATTTQDQTQTTVTDQTTQLSDEQRIEEERVEREEVTEQLFARPNVAPVFAMSPADFLGRRDPGMLSSVVRQRQGRERALATRGPGGVVSGARRV
jgi:hypothetical protein